MDLHQSEIRNAHSNRANISTVSLFMSRVYAWMTTGMLVTCAISYYVGSQPDLVQNFLTNPFFFFGSIFVQFFMVMYLSYDIDKISIMNAALSYLILTLLLGLLTSVIFIHYTHESIAIAFGITAIAFGSLSLFGYITKYDLGPLALFCMMGLFGILGLLLLSYFIPSLRGEKYVLIASAINVIIFAGLSACDTQEIKNRYINNDDNRTEQRAIISALYLYLDFYNLFINILRLIKK